MVPNRNTANLQLLQKRLLAMYFAWCWITMEIVDAANRLILCYFFRFH
jgi:hypothetical protein